MLLGRVIKLNMGYVGIKNRSQQDILDGMPVKRALQLEKQYFVQHHVYSSMPKGHLGADVLTKKLSKILYKHIRKHLPHIIREIKDKVRDCKSRLSELGPPLPGEERGKIHLMWKMINTFTDTFLKSIKGKYEPRRNL